MAPIRLFLCSIVIAFSFAGCATEHKVAINSFVLPNAPVGGRYALVPNMAGVDLNDLQFQEARNYLRPILAAKGFVETDNPDLIVLISYGIGEPIQQTFTRPIFGQTSGGTARYSGTVSGPTGTSYSSGTVYQQPTFGVTGYSSGTRVTLPKYLWLSAFDARRYATTKEVVYFWQVGGVAGDQSGDLRATIPLLLSATADYIGKSTGKVVWVRL